jgi:sialidase-1
MEHFVVFKQRGHYSAHPNMAILPDGRLVIGTRVQTWANHEPVGDWQTFLSNDNGETWTPTNDPTVPYNWPGKTPREKLERFERILPDGSWLCGGATGQEIWPASGRDEALRLGLEVLEHPTDSTIISVLGDRLFIQRSADEGKTWSRREWTIPNVRYVSSNRPTTYLEDGTILCPVSVLWRIDAEDVQDRSSIFVWRSTDNGETWRLRPMGTSPFSLEPNETGMVEVSPGNILAHTRVEYDRDRSVGRADAYYLVEHWSDDGGRTWTDPVRTEIWGFPAHLIKLRDGRILSAYGYRREPAGVRAVLSEDGGNSWDLANEVVLRDDGGYISDAPRSNPARWQSDVGYPVSVQLPDDLILTAYYITESDGITHTAVTRWRPPA